MRRGRRLGIRAKISLGFVIVVAMLIISDLLSLRELSQIGGDVRRILDDSYRSVEYGQGMLNQLAGQQFYVFEQRTGDEAQRARAEREFAASRTSFLSLVGLAKANLKHTGEGAVLDSIEALYKLYREAADEVLQSPPVGKTECVHQLRVIMERLRLQINGLVLLNQKALYSAVRVLDASTRRAVRPGILVLLVGVLFIVMVVYLLNRFYVLPIIRMTRMIHQYIRFGRYRAEPLRSRDELEDLSDAVDSLVQHAQHCQQGGHPGGRGG